LAARLYTRMRLADRHRPIANLVISNVPGPDFPLYFGGAEMLAAFPLGPVMDGMGLNITIMSYRGVLYWGIMASPDNIPKIWNLTAGIPSALDELLAAAGEPVATFRSEDAVQALRASGIDVGGRPPAQGAGATAMDEAPEHTGMARPKVSEAGS
ncbi:MAG TPA: WS/DGAT domain-containing protein, partial [Acidimicrobiales bacterium]|nr:WS/DGAT domain-containing protein [Acidimicrobiales bacterium]